MVEDKVNEKEINSEYYKTHTGHPWQEAIGHVAKKFANYVDNKLIDKYLKRG